MFVMNLHLYKVIFTIVIFEGIWGYLYLLECLYNYRFYIYQKVVFIEVKDNSEYVIHYEVYMYQKVISCYY